MATNLTQPTDVPVSSYLDTVEPAQRQADARTLHALMKAVSGEPGRMWGASMVGFGTYDYTYASGRTGSWMRLGYAARKSALTVYLCNGGMERFTSYLNRLGKHTTGMGCLYLKKLADADPAVLEELLRAAWEMPSLTLYESAQAQGKVKPEASPKTTSKPTPKKA